MTFIASETTGRDAPGSSSTATDTAEPNETFAVTIGAIVNGTAPSPTATVTILNDDAAAHPAGSRPSRCTTGNCDGKIDRIDRHLQRDAPIRCSQRARSRSRRSLAACRSRACRSRGEHDNGHPRGGQRSTPRTPTSLLRWPAAACATSTAANVTFQRDETRRPRLSVPMSTTDSDGATDGTWQSGDFVQFTFSEPMDPASIARQLTRCSREAMATAPRPTTGSARPRSHGDISLGAANYITGNGANNNANFQGSTISFSGNTIRLTLRHLCPAAARTAPTTARPTSRRRPRGRHLHLCRRTSRSRRRRPLGAVDHRLQLEDLLMGVTMKKTRFHSERGATAVLMAFGMVGLLAFGGLVLDGGTRSPSVVRCRTPPTRRPRPAPTSSTGTRRGETGHGTSTPRPVTWRCPTGPARRASPASSSCTPGRRRPVRRRAERVGRQQGRGLKVRVDVDSTHDTRLMRVVNIDSFKAGAGCGGCAPRRDRGEGPFLSAAAPTTTGRPALWTPTHCSTRRIDQRPTPSATRTRSGARRSKTEGAEQDCGLGTQLPGPRGEGLRWDHLRYVAGGAGQQGRVGGRRPRSIGGCGMHDGDHIKDIPAGCEFAIPLCTGAGAGFSLYCVNVGRFRSSTRTRTASSCTASSSAAGSCRTAQAAGSRRPTADLMIIKLIE